MIEGKDGLKIAENKDIAFWEKIKDRSRTDIFNGERSLELDTIILDYAEKKLEELNEELASG